MNTELISTLTQTFEGHAQLTKSGVEYWLARDIQHLLGYTKWDNFLNVISKAKTACEVSGHRVADHFADVGKMVDLGSGSQRETCTVSAVSFLDGQGFFANIAKSSLRVASAKGRGAAAARRGPCFLA